MNIRYQICGFAIMAFFYAVYIGKMLLQKKRGIVTNQIAKDKTDKKRYAIELSMKIATYGIILVEVVSIIIGKSVFRYSLKTPGIICGIAGDIFFITAVITMADSWRAGIAAEEHRELVSKGIFKISRNPAFVGFDLVYMSILLMFFNWILLLFTVFAMVMLHLQMLQEEKYLVGEFGDSYKNYKKRVCRYFGLRTWKFWLPVCVVLGILIALGILNTKSKMDKLNNMSFEDSLCYTTKNNPSAVITVGILKDGKATYKVYGKNGKEIPAALHTYEIGSITKTITACCINKAIQEGKINLSDPIDVYLDLPAGKNYPTIEKLLTHTSGYKSHYVNGKFLLNVLLDRNAFAFINKKDICRTLASVNLKEKQYPWNYSNFGFAVLGLILEEVYDETYCSIVNKFMKDLGMENSAFTINKGDLGNYWKWGMRDAYASAGAVRSNIVDMLLYADLQMNDVNFSQMHEPLKSEMQTPAQYEMLDINMDQIAMSWILDNKNGFIWHNGGTSDYNSYLGICKEKNCAVVILSNLPGGYRIPATVLGIKLLKEFSK